MAHFKQLIDGISYSQAEYMLGCPGEETSSSDIGSIKTIMYSWKGDHFMSNMNAMFQNDRMVSKAQFGLR